MRFVKEIIYSPIKYRGQGTSALGFVYIADKNNYVKISFCVLFQAAKLRGNGILACWVSKIRNHFWHSAKTCDGDVHKLKVP